MAAFKVNLAITQGETFDKTWTWKAAGVPVNLTGCTAKAQLRADETTSALGLELTPYVTLGGAAGTIRLVIPKTITATMVPFDGFGWDLFVEFADTSDRRVMAGSVGVTPAITKPSP